MARVFISHASADHSLAAEVMGWLSGDGHDVFLDRDVSRGLVVGDLWQQRLYERLRWADAVVCLITEAYLASAWCAAEAGIATARGSRVLPLRAAPHLNHPILASAIQYADLSEPEGARAGLREALARVDAAGGLGWTDGRSPFPGLRAFDTDMHRVFFGRQSEVRDLAALLRSPTGASDGLIAVVGPSGCGKSSLVRAGLLPLMASEQSWWTLPPVLPGVKPVRALARELTAVGRQLGLPWTLADLHDRLDDDDDGLAALADELLLAAPGARSRRLLLVIDQLEELLTRTGPRERARFSGLLRAALAGPVRVVSTIRPEFLAQLLGVPELTGLPVQPFAVRPLRPETLSAVIEGPAELAGLSLDAELAGRLVADTGSGEALPLLAFTLEQLAAGLVRGDRLSLARYEELGGVHGALVRQADAALAEAVASGGRTDEDVIAGLLRLVTVDEQGRPTRRRVSRQELPEAVRAESDAFVARRLLATDAEDGVVVLEVAHEAFLSAWPPLAQAISASAAALRARRAVEHAAAEWDSAGQQVSRLWERGQLAACLNDLRAHRRTADGSPRTANGSMPSRPERKRSRWPLRQTRITLTDSIGISTRATQFLQASIGRDRRRRARVTTVLSVLLAVAVVAAAIAVVQRSAAEEQQRLAVQQRAAAEEQQRIATARQLVAQADAARDTDPRTALQLGIAAQYIHPDGQVQASLVDTLLSTRMAASLSSHSNKVTSVAFTRDGQTLASADRDGAVILWNLSARAAPRSLGRLETGHTEGVTAMAFSLDGQTLATGGIGNGTVILWDVRNRATPSRLGQPLVGHSTSEPDSEVGGVSAMAFTADGETLVSGDIRDGTVIFWDVRNRAAAHRAGRLDTGHPQGVSAVAFVPGKQTLVTTGHLDGKVILWDVRYRRDRVVPHRVGRLETGHTDGVTAVAFTQDGQTLVTGGIPDGRVILWDVRNWGDRVEPRGVGWLETGHARVTAVALAHDGQTLVTAGAEGKAILWDVRNRVAPRRLGQPLIGHADELNAVAFAPDEKTLATASSDRTVILWDTSHRATPRRVSRLQTDQAELESPLIFAPDGQTMVTVRFGDRGGRATLWDVRNRAAPRRVGRLEAGRTEAVTAAFTRDGQTLATACFDDGRAILWDVRNRLLRAASANCRLGAWAR